MANRERARRSLASAGGSEVTSAEATAGGTIAGSSVAASADHDAASQAAPTSSSPPPQPDGAPSTTATSQSSPHPSPPPPSQTSPSPQTLNNEEVDVVEEKKAFLKSLTGSRPVSQSRSMEGTGTDDANAKKPARRSSCSSIIRKIRSRDITSTVLQLQSSNTELKGLTCAVCLEIYTNPKFLPCHHTYCAHCIEDLAARRTNKPFKCPSCRKEVTLPQGGVNALQHNFYIKQEDLEKAARGFKDTTKCKAHAQQELDMYCIQCEQVVCFKCVLTKHKDHALEDLTEAAEEAAEQLKDARPRLDEVIKQVTQHVERQQREQHDLQEKIAALKRNLQNRHNTILAAVHQYLDERQAQVDRLTEQVFMEVKEDAAFAQSYLNALTQLQKVMDTAIRTKARVELVEADRDMRVGFGCRLAVDELLAQRRTRLTRPVLHFQRYTAETLLVLKEFFGEVILLDVPAEDSEEILVEKFRCGDAIDTEVFSICPKDNDTLSLSYERRRLQQQAPSEGVDVKGKHQYTRKEALGKSTWKSRGKGKGVFVGQLPGQLRTYCKGQNTEVFLRLDNHLQGRADVKKETILSESPYKSKLSREGTIKCGPHRAFDVDDTHSLYAVVEEGSFPKSMRRVLLFRKSAEAEIAAVWTSPLPFCQPTDVCFYCLDGKQVLLIADEMNDTIYVVDYPEGKLSFLRFLAAGSPLMVQPTALNVDVHQRLWVACRGGGVLMMEPASSGSGKEQASVV